MKRIEYLDNAKGFAMIMVIIGHIMTKPNPFRNWFYSFHIPLFFIISGFLLSRKQKQSESLKIDIKKKFKDLMVPYFLFSVINSFLLAIYSFINNKNYSTIFAEIKANIKSIFLLNGVKATWFLPCMFIALIIFFLLYNTFKNKKMFIISIIGLFVLPFLNINMSGYYSERVLFRSFIASGFILVGYLGEKYVEKIPNKWSIVIGVNALNFLYVWLGKSNVDLCYLKLGDFFVYSICGILGTIGIMLLYRKILSINIKCKLSSYIGKNSLVIMGTHMLVVYYLKMLFSKVIGQTFINNLYSYVPVMLICVILIEFLIVAIYNKIFPWFMTKLEKEWCKYANNI